MILYLSKDFALDMVIGSASEVASALAFSGIVALTLGTAPVFLVALATFSVGVGVYTVLDDLKDEYIMN